MQIFEVIKGENPEERAKLVNLGQDLSDSEISHLESLKKLWFQNREAEKNSVGSSSQRTFSIFLKGLDVNDGDHGI